MKIIFLNRVENIVVKGEIAHYEYLLLPEYFIMLKMYLHVGEGLKHLLIVP